MNFTIEHNLHRTSGIYSITNSIDARFYIGSTINFWRRYGDHKGRLKHKEHANKYLQAFSNKYGIDKLNFNLLYPCKNTCLRYNEKLWIELLKPQFNLKKLITRPYFDDEIQFEIKNYKPPLYFRMSEEEEREWREYRNKYPPLEHLTFAEEMDYYSGDYPSSPFPRKIKTEIPNMEYKYISRETRSEKAKRLSRVIQELRAEYRICGAQIK